MASNGSNERVDPRSNKDRGIDLIPGKHLGVEAAAMERRKKKSRIGDLNRDIAEGNQQITVLHKERAGLDKDIATYQADPLRYQHEQMAASLKKAFRKHKVKKLAGRIAMNTAEEALKKRLIQAPTIEPPQNPLDPTPGGSYAARIRMQQQQDNEITR